LALCIVLHDSSHAGDARAMRVGLPVPIPEMVQNLLETSWWTLAFFAQSAQADPMGFDPKRGR